MACDRREKREHWCHAHTHIHEHIIEIPPLFRFAGILRKRSARKLEFCRIACGGRFQYTFGKFCILCSDVVSAPDTRSNIQAHVLNVSDASVRIVQLDIRRIIYHFIWILLNFISIKDGAKRLTFACYFWPHSKRGLHFKIWNKLKNSCHVAKQFNPNNWLSLTPPFSFLRKCHQRTILSQGNF